MPSSVEKEGAVRRSEGFNFEFDGDHYLTIEQIWPDGDAPDTPTVDDVIAVLQSHAAASHGSSVTGSLAAPSSSTERTLVYVTTEFECPVCHAPLMGPNETLWDRIAAALVEHSTFTAAQPESPSSSTEGGTDDSYYLCFGCEQITHADKWTYWQLDEGEYRAPRDGDSDSHLKCPNCGEMHGDNYVGDGLEEGTLVQCEAAKAKFLTDESATTPPDGVLERLSAWAEQTADEGGHS